MAAPATRCPVHAEFDPLGFPSLHLAPPDQAVPFHPDISFRGPQTLWLKA